MRYIKFVIFIFFFLIMAVANSAMYAYSYIVRKVGNKPFYILGDILYALGIGILGSVLYAELSFGALMSNNGLISIALIIIGAIYREKNK